MRLIGPAPITGKVSTSSIDDEAVTAAKLASGVIPVSASATDMRLSFLLVAENQSDRLNMADGFADAFENDDDEAGGVDASTSSGETYDSASDFYHNPASAVLLSNTAGTAFGTSPSSGGGLASAFDNTTTGNGGNQYYVATCDSAHVGKDWGDGNDELLNKYEVWPSADQGWITGTGAVDKFQLYGSDSSPSDGEDGTLLLENLEIAHRIDNNPTTIAGGTSNAYRYHWFRMEPGQSGSVFINEIKFYKSGEDAANMTLVSNAFTASSAPDTGRVHIQVKPIDAITINTDLTAEISRGNDEWTASTLALVATLADGTKAYEDASVDISGQTSAVAMKYRIKTLNSKEVQIHGVVLQWA